MPDLDLIKQVEQGVRDRRRRSPGASRAILPAARLGADTFVRAIEIGNFDRRLKLR